MGIAIALISILTALHFAFGAPSFLIEQQGSFLAACAYSFFHANIWHLLVNCLAIWGLFAKSKQPRNHFAHLATALIIAILVSPLSALPPIGFSNIIYALIGLRTPALSSPWWRRWPVIVFLLASVAMIPVPTVASVPHLAAFAIAVGCAYLVRFYYTLTADARKYL